MQVDDAARGEILRELTAMLHAVVGEDWIHETPITIETPPGVVRPLAVLLVDDHPEVRSTTAALLADSGHRVVQAENGTDALALLRTRECDFELLITDYAMPHLSGTEFLREARLLCPGVPALLITGYADGEMIRDRPAGVETLLKPFTPTQLECAMAKAVSDVSVPAAAPPAKAKRPAQSSERVKS